MDSAADGAVRHVSALRAFVALGCVRVWRLPEGRSAAVLSVLQLRDLDAAQ